MLSYVNSVKPHLTYPRCQAERTPSPFGQHALRHYRPGSGLALEPCPLPPLASYLGSGGATLTSHFLDARCTPALGR